MATTNKLTSLRVFSSTPLTLLSPQAGSSGSVERAFYLAVLEAFGAGMPRNNLKKPTLS